MIAELLVIVTASISLGLNISEGKSADRLILNVLVISLAVIALVVSTIQVLKKSK